MSSPPPFTEGRRQRVRTSASYVAHRRETNMCTRPPSRPLEYSIVSSLDTIHEPVMRGEVLELLDVPAGGRYIDATVGAGGHARAILEAAPDVRLLGVDRDPLVLEVARERLATFGEAVTLRHGRFDELPRLASETGFESVSGVLFDLGVSSMQLDTPGRGFSFRRDEPLDMRMDPTAEGPTAADIVNDYEERDLANVLREFGEERRSRAIARVMVSCRPLRTTKDLVTAIEQAVGPGRERLGNVHPATRTFQALRIAVNQELSLLAAALPGAHGLLAGGGRFVVLSFHSLEDRTVKRFFRRESTDCLCPPRSPACVCGHIATLIELTRRPLRPSTVEVERNPRARSAKLRVAERILAQADK